jgi:hypothetical protein
MKYLWGLLSTENNIVRIMVSANLKNFYEGLFKRLELLPLQFKSTFPLMNFTVNSQENF